MTSLASPNRVVIGGIDTHKDLHVVAALDLNGALLGTEQFATTRAGYRRLLAWLQAFGDVRCIGIEGTGSYGAGITRHLMQAGLPVLEVDRPDRSERRRRGKNDTLDAEAAAPAARAGHRTSVPKTKAGRVEALRVLRLTRSTAVKARRAALQVLRNQIVSAPEDVREPLRHLTRMELIRVCAAARPNSSGFREPTIATRLALKSLARP